MFSFLIFFLFNFTINLKELYKYCMVLSCNNHWFKDILNSDRHIAFSFASCNMPVFMQNIFSPKVIAFKRHAIYTKTFSFNQVNIKVTGVGYENSLRLLLKASYNGMKLKYRAFISEVGTTVSKVTENFFYLFKI